MDLKLDVARTYLDVLRVDKILRLARTMSPLSRHTSAMYRTCTGRVSPSERTCWLRRFLAKRRQRVIQAGNEAEIAKAAYNRLLGRPLPEDTQLQEMTLRNDFNAGTNPGPTEDDHLPSALGLGAHAHAQRSGPKRRDRAVDGNGSGRVARSLPVCLTRPRLTPRRPGPSRRSRNRRSDSSADSPTSPIPTWRPRTTGPACWPRRGCSSTATARPQGRGAEDERVPDPA